MASNTFSQDSSGLISPVLLGKIDQLREKNIGKHVPLPQLVVVGDQSSGKSSLLENLTGIPFPRDVELCTRYATQITSRRDTESRVDVSITPGPQASEEHVAHLNGFHYSLRSGDVFRAEFPKILKEVNMRMGIRSNVSSSKGTVFSEDRLKIEICGPNEDYLTVIDVPGIFRNPNKGVTTKKDIKLVKEMVRTNIKEARTIILAVMPCNVDIATQEILTIAEEADPTGDRTLGVLTKPDLVKEQRSRDAVCGLVLGKKKQLTLGWYVVVNRGADDDDNASDVNVRERIFSEEPYCTLPLDQVGVKALKTRLTVLLGEITRREFPKLRKEIKEKLKKAQDDLTGLGQARQNERQQRTYISTIARGFQDLVRDALEAQYSNNRLFEREQMRLITGVVFLSDIFNHMFETKAHLRNFEVTQSSEDEDETRKTPNQAVIDSASTGTGHIRQRKHKTDSVANQSAKISASVVTDVSQPVNQMDDSRWLGDPNEFPELDGIISHEGAVTEPVDGIMGWIEEVHVQSRGVELGTFGANVLSTAFKEQSMKWEPMTRAFVSKVIIVIHRFMNETLRTLCPDDTVRTELWSAISDRVLLKYESAMRDATRLAEIERANRPYTLNQYFNSSLQTARGYRTAQKLEGKTRQEMKYNNEAQRLCASDVVVVDFEAVKTAAKNRSNVEHTTEEIHDILQSYYKVARKRFVDNIFMQVITHLLLGGPEGPLAVFSQEWVLDLEAEQLQNIAGESVAVSQKREKFAKKVEDLTLALKILRP